VDQLGSGDEERFAVAPDGVAASLRLAALGLADRAGAGVDLVRLAGAVPEHRVLVVHDVVAPAVVHVLAVLPQQLGVVDRIAQHRVQRPVVLVQAPQALADLHAALALDHAELALGERDVLDGARHG
jgi:hypothetical protein